MTYEEMLRALRDARPASFTAPTTKALSNPPLTARDLALIRGFAVSIHEYVKTEIASVVEPHLKRIEALEARIAKLETLTASRPPADERRGHGDAHGPDFSALPTAHPRSDAATAHARNGSAGPPASPRFK
jgi:hypothetical protein